MAKEAAIEGELYNNFVTSRVVITSFQLDWKLQILIIFSC